MSDADKLEAISRVLDKSWRGQWTKGATAQAIRDILDGDDQGPGLRIEVEHMKRK